MASTDRDVLVVLFRSNGGAGWLRKDNWDTDAELAKWHSVRVNREGRVAKIHLNNHKLKGEYYSRDSTYRGGRIGLMSYGFGSMQN